VLSKNQHILLILSAEFYGVEKVTWRGGGWRVAACVLISVYGGSRWWGTDPRDKYNYSTLLEITAKNLAQAGNLPGQYFFNTIFQRHNFL
jgi:hypothetical protein